MIEISIDHKNAKQGIPVILINGRICNKHPKGIRDVREELGMTTEQLAAESGKKFKTVEGYFYGRECPAEFLLVLRRLLLEKSKKKK